MSNVYEHLKICIRHTKKISKLSLLTGLSKSTLQLIANGRGKYKGCLSTQLVLEEWSQRLENYPGQTIIVSKKR